MPYTADMRRTPPTPEELRARIPGWGADLDPRDRPSEPRERYAPEATGAHWVFPERQEERWPRERSLEHRFLTPVFGTSTPPRGLSGAVRRLAYRRFSEGQTTHWGLLIAADRIDAVESHLRSFATRRPDNPLIETGILGEAGHHPVSSRFGRRRVDLRHQWIDPILVAGPWVAAPVAAILVARRLLRAARG